MNNPLVDHLLKQGIQDNAIIKAFLRADRKLFVPGSQQSEAYMDYPLPIGNRQTISQPSLVAKMTELLALKPTDKVLEIGTGSGYQTAILAEICEHVYTMEIIEPLYTRSAALLEQLGYQNITCKHASGYDGWQDQAPFNGIIVTCAPPEVPPLLIEQLQVGGKMIIPVGTANQQLLEIKKDESGNIQSREVVAVRFVPMTDDTEPA